jgi:hypothetical protein
VSRERANIDLIYVQAELAKGRSQREIARELAVDSSVLSRHLARATPARPLQAMAEVQYGAVGEFDRLPDGYAKTIQPMRPYSEAEEAALQESMRLYGFIGAIVKDQYGRILDGHHRQRIARLSGRGVPYTITQVRDDAHAMEIARAANVVRRHYTQQQREEIAPILRDQGFSYRAIAEALGVSHTQARADAEGGAPTGERLESTFQSGEVGRINRKGGGTYPSKRQTVPRVEVDALPADQRRTPREVKPSPAKVALEDVRHARNKLVAAFERVAAFDRTDGEESILAELLEKALDDIIDIATKAKQTIFRAI